MIRRCPTGTAGQKSVQGLGLGTRTCVGPVHVDQGARGVVAQREDSRHALHAARDVSS